MGRVTVVCPYCDKPAKLVTGAVLYPHRPELWKLFFWQCSPCSAHVGCHKNSPDHKPLGRLANRELREAKSRAHAVFDPVWQGGEMTRNEAYKWLQNLLGMDRQPHIGFMDVDQCRRVVIEVMAARHPAPAPQPL